MTDHRSDGVVVHLPDGDRDRQHAVLRNVVNLLRALGDGTTVEIVTHGPGVALCTGETNLGEAVAEVQCARVTVCACANTLAARRLSEKDLLPGIAVVPSGVARLVERQREGWSYLRP